MHWIDVISVLRLISILEGCVEFESHTVLYYKRCWLRSCSECLSQCRGIEQNFVDSVTVERYTNLHYHKCH